MDYLLLQILLFLILAAVVGFFIGWITRGFGFESRLLASENQWRTRHHVLQSENNRLQSELDDCLQEIKESLLNIQNDDIALSLPFSSTQEPSSPGKSAKQPPPQLSDTEEPVQDHPLERLRSELNQIENAQTAKQFPEQTEISVRLDQPDGDADDLKIIKGIGPKIESTLNKLGIYYFSQIADFTENDIIWVNDHLQFSGRIEREKWIAQAQDLISKSDA